MLPRRKIYIDSRYKTQDSISNANFKIQLNENLKFPDNCGFYITDICIPNTFKTIEEGVNDRLYVRFDFYPALTTEFNIITLPPRNYTGYTLATELVKLLNAAAAKFSPVIWNFTCTYDQGVNTLTITGNLKSGITDLRNSWEFYTDNTLKTYQNWTGPEYDKTNLHSFNSNLQNISPQRFTDKQSYICNFLDLHSIKNIYLSSNMANFDSINPQGYPSNIVKKIPLTADYGYLIVDNLMTLNDYLSCSNRTFSQLDFKFTNTEGLELPIYGMNISFTIIFVKLSDSV